MYPLKQLLFIPSVLSLHDVVWRMDICGSWMRESWEFFKSFEFPRVRICHVHSRCPLSHRHQDRVGPGGMYQIPVLNNTMISMWILEVPNNGVVSKKKK